MSHFFLSRCDKNAKMKSGEKEIFMGDKILSVIVPVHNEEQAIIRFYDAIGSLEFKIVLNVQFIFIDDGSTDNSLGILRKLRQGDTHVHYISFSRNFGKEAGIYAGLQKATGDFVVVMDVDLQDPPDLLPKMLDIVTNDDYDVVATRRSSRSGEAPIRSWFSKKFYTIMNKISDVPLVDGARDYRLMTRQVVDAILEISENQRFSKGIFSWVGFKTKYISYKNIPRVGGSSSWSFWSLCKYAVQGIISFSTVPLTIITYLGVGTCIVSILSAIFVVARALLFHNSAAGWPSMVTILLFVGGVQLLSLGVIGRYISAIFLEVKNRPIYITRESDQN